MLARNEQAPAPSVPVCSERQRLLDLLREALEDFSATVRKPQASGEASGGSTTAARNACETIWRNLLRHQAEHKCWR
jgi:hypothetical protein